MGAQTEKASLRELKEFASLVFEMTRRMEWLGGVRKGSNLADWPSEVVDVFNRRDRHHWREEFWSLSPEVRLGGHRVQVCVSSEKNTEHAHDVWVFIDGQLKHPGGWYSESLGFFSLSYWFPSLRPWSYRVAAIERAEGGLPGPVDRRDLLIAEAKERLSGKTPVVEEPEDPAARAAVAEVEAMLRRQRE